MLDPRWFVETQLREMRSTTGSVRAQMRREAELLLARERQERRGRRKLWLRVDLRERSIAGERISWA